MKAKTTRVLAALLPFGLAATDTNSRDGLHYERKPRRGSAIMPAVWSDL